MNPTFAREWRWLAVCIALGAVVPNALLAALVAQNGRTSWGTFQDVWQTVSLFGLGAAIIGPALYLGTGFIRLTVAAFRSK